MKEGGHQREKISAAITGPVAAHCKRKGKVKAKLKIIK